MGYLFRYSIVFYNICVCDWPDLASDLLLYRTAALMWWSVFTVHESNAIRTNACKCSKYFICFVCVCSRSVRSCDAFSFQPDRIRVCRAHAMQNVIDDRITNRNQLIFYTRTNIWVRYILVDLNQIFDTRSRTLTRAGVPCMENGR